MRGPEQLGNWINELTREEVLEQGLQEIRLMAPGHHLDPENPCYGEKRKISDIAKRWMEFADKVPTQ